MTVARPDRTTLAIVAEGFLSRLGFGIVSLALPLYALHLGMGVATVGLLLSVNVVVQLVAKPAMGVVVDLVGTRRALILAIAVRSAVPTLLAVAHAPWELFAIRGVYGAAQSLRDPALNAVIADAGGRARVARTFAWYHTAKNVAASVGRAAAGLLVTITGGAYGLVFGCAGAVSLLPLAVVVAAVGRGATTMRAATDPPAGAPRTRVAPFTALALMFGTTAGMLNIFPVLATRYFGLSPAQIGVITLATTVVVIIAGPAFGWLADDVSRRLVLLVRAVANIVSSALYLVLPGALGAGAAKSVDDLGKAAFRPAWGSVMAEVASRDRARRARTLALIEMGEDGGDALGPVLAGSLLGLGGMPLMFGVRVALAALTELCAHRVGRTLDAGPTRSTPRSRDAYRGGAVTTTVAKAGPARPDQPAGGAP